MCKHRLSKASNFPVRPGSLFCAERYDVIHWSLCNENQRISFPRIRQAGKGVFRSQNSEKHNSFCDGAVKVEQKFLATPAHFIFRSEDSSRVSPLQPQLSIPSPRARQAAVHGKQLNATPWSWAEPQASPGKTWETLTRFWSSHNENKWGLQFNVVTKNLFFPPF